MVGTFGRVSQLREPGIAVSVRSDLNLVHDLIKRYQSCSAAPSLSQLVHVDFVYIAHFLTTVAIAHAFIEVLASSIASEVMD